MIVLIDTFDIFVIGLLCFCFGCIIGGIVMWFDYKNRLLPYESMTFKTWLFEHKR